MSIAKSEHFSFVADQAEAAAAETEQAEQQQAEPKRKRKKLSPSLAAIAAIEEILDELPLEEQAKVMSWTYESVARRHAQTHGPLTPPPGV